MAETKAYTYKNISAAKKVMGKLKGKVSAADLKTSLIGIFLAMAMPLPGVAPFGMAYLAQERRLSLKAIFVFVATSAGSMFVCDRLGSVRYICAGLLYLAALFVLKKGIRLTDVTAGVIAAICTLATGTAMLVIEGFSALDFVLLLCEAALVVSGTLMMEKSVSVIKSRDFSSQSLDSDAKISLASVILVALLGFKEIYIGSTFSVMNTIAALILLVFSASCGAGYSTGTGIVLGMVCGIGSDFFMAILGAFGFCGFLAGAFSKFGKGGATAGIILANGIMTVYTNNATEAVLSLWEIVAAAVAFGFFPTSRLEMIKEVITLKDGERESIAKVKEDIKARLRTVASAFESMAKTLDRLSDKEKMRNDEDCASLFDVAAEKACKNCRKSGVCWGQSFNSTYEQMFALLNVMKEKGVAKKEDVDSVFASRCINLDAFLAEVNHQFDIYRVRQVWRSRLCESRHLAGKQLGGVSDILENLTDEMDSDTKKTAISGWELRSRLEISGIRPKSVNIMQDKYGRNRVEIVLKASKFQSKERRIAEKIIKSYAGCGCLVREEVAEDKRLTRLVFSEEQKFEVETEHATAAACEKNGDNFKFLKLKNGKFIIAISDGMGTGHRAAKESEAILELLDSFLEAGFDSRIAVRLINSIMIMKSDDEAFVTLDLCIIDLYTGEAQFIKTGAEPSFVLDSGGRVRLVKSSSLPVGLIADAEAEVSKTKLRDGDRIVMMTDGIENRQDGSLWVSEFVKNNCDDSENMAQKILSHAAERQNGTARDDMTVLSVKLKAVG